MAYAGSDVIPIEIENPGPVRRVDDPLPVLRVRGGTGVFGALQKIPEAGPVRADDRDIATVPDRIIEHNLVPRRAPPGVVDLFAGRVCRDKPESGPVYAGDGKIRGAVRGDHEDQTITGGRDRRARCPPVVRDALLLLRAEVVRIQIELQRPVRMVPRVLPVVQRGPV